MAKNFLGIKVFLAAPSDLKDEREHFKKIVWKFNEIVAFDSGAVIIPVMADQMIGGHGQAQGHINKNIECCDYCITMFWDNLGSPPEEDSPEGSVSVTDGEHKKAVMLKNAGILREAVIFFKRIPQPRIDDKGPALEAMLNYIQERQKDSHYVPFDGAGQFEEEIWKHLLRWFLSFTTLTGDKKETSATVRDYANPGSD